MINHRWGAWLCGAAVFAIVFCVFLPVLRNQFVDWDDTDNFLRNPDYRGLGWPNIQWMFTTFHMGHYQPLTWLTLGIDATWGKLLWNDALDPRPYHFTNVLLHAVNSVLVFLLALRLIGWNAIHQGHAKPRDGHPWAWHGWALIIGAAAAALLFGVHPLRVESVAWATERRDLLSGFFLLLAALAYLRANRPDQTHHWRWVWISMGLFTCSLLSKVIGVTLPVVLLILDWHPLKRLWIWDFGFWRAFQKAPMANPTPKFQNPQFLPLLLEKLPFFVLSAVFSTIASVGQGSHNWLVTLEQHGVAARFVQSVYGLMYYLWKTLLPLHLQPLYQLHYPMDIHEARYAVAGVVVGLVAALLLYLMVRRRGSAVVAAAMIYAVMLAPVLGIMQNGSQIVADRYSYLPCIGWAIVAGAGVTLLWRTGRTPLIVGASLVVLTAIIALSGLTWRLTQVWRDTASLWTRAYQEDPRGGFAQNGYGYVLLQQGQLDQAIDLFRRAIQTIPRNDKAHNNLWNALRRKGDIPALIAAFQQAMSIDTVAASAHDGYGSLLLEQRDNAAAAEQFRAVLALQPNHLKARTNLGVTLLRLGRGDEAIEQFRHAIQIDPAFFPARYHLGLALRNAGRTVEAIEQLRIATQLNPSHAGARTALSQLAQPPP